MNKTKDLKSKKKKNQEVDKKYFKNEHFITKEDLARETARKTRRFIVEQEPEVIEEPHSEIVEKVTEKKLTIKPASLPVATSQNKLPEKQVLQNQILENTHPAKSCEPMITTTQKTQQKREKQDSVKNTVPIYEAEVDIFSRELSHKDIIYLTFFILLSLLVFGWLLMT